MNQFLVHGDSNINVTLLIYKLLLVLIIIFSSEVVNLMSKLFVCFIDIDWSLTVITYKFQMFFFHIWLDIYLEINNLLDSSLKKKSPKNSEWCILDVI